MAQQALDSMEETLLQEFISENWAAFVRHGQHYGFDEDTLNDLYDKLENQ